MEKFEVDLYGGFEAVILTTNAKLPKSAKYKCTIYSRFYPGLS